MYVVPTRSVANSSQERRLLKSLRSLKSLESLKSLKMLKMPRVLEEILHEP